MEKKRLLRIYMAGHLNGFLLSSSIICVTLLSIDRFSASPFELGILGFLINFLYSFFTFLAGITRLKFHRAKLLKISTFILFLIFPLFPFLPHLYGVIALFGLYGILQSWIWPALQAGLHHRDEKSLSRTTGNYNIAWSSGNILGAYLGGKIYEISFSFPFFLASFIYLLMFLILKDISLPSPPEEAPSLSSPYPYYLRISRIFNLLNFMAIGAILFLFPKLAKLYGFTPSLIGILFSVFFAGRGVFFFLWRIYTGWRYRFLPLFLAPSLSILTLFILYLFSSPIWIGLGFLFLSISNTLIYSAALLATLDLKSSGMVTSEINESILGAGLFLGPLLTGWVSRFLSLPGAFLSLLPLFIIGEIVSGMIYRQKLRKR